VTQARANGIKRPGWARSLPRQFPPPIGGVMQLSLIGTPALPRWLAQSGLVPELRFSAPMSLPFTPIDLPASWNLWIPVSAQRRRWR
jgi:hypothetical protein